MLYLADTTRAMIGNLAGYVLLYGPLDLKVSFPTPLINLRDKINLLDLFSRSEMKVTCSCFLSSIYGLSAYNVICNLQYRPRTRLVIGFKYQEVTFLKPLQVSNN